MSKKKISVCVFPDTMPADDMMFPLAHIFSQVVYSRPVETDGETIEMIDYLRVHVPAPLKEQQDRFLSLLDELQSWSNDYAEQLKNLTLSKIGTGELETKYSIISNLHNSKGMDRKAEDLDILLWQARLVLSLGEFFDQAQRELTRELAIINEREKELLDELRQDSNHLFDLTRKISTTIGQSNGLQWLRFKAWSRLFYLGSEPLSSVDCFVSTDRDAIDMMLEVYEKISGNNIKPFITLRLPAFTPDIPIQFDKIKELQQAELPLILSSIFSCSVGRENGIDYDRLQTDWEDSLETLYPVVDTDRVNLHIYKFPGIQPCDLFLKSFVREDKPFCVGKENNGVWGIICWLEN